MISTVTVCPFIDTDHLAETADKGSELLDGEIDAILKTIKDLNPMYATKLNRLDDLMIAARVGIQNATIRATICVYCDKDTECRPAT